MVNDDRSTATPGIPLPAQRQKQRNRRRRYAREIDAQKWANEYGIDIKDVKSDVAGYFKTFCDDHIEMLGLGKEAK